MNKPTTKLLDNLAYGLVALFALDRLFKLAAVIHFFRRTPPPDPQPWPSVTLLQPITRGASSLATNLHTRATLDYPANVQHLLICDTHDHATQATCRTHLNKFPALHAEIILANPNSMPLATKIEKLNAALPHATGDILCFVDDDIALRPKALQILSSHLLQPQTGAVFGLACYTNWHTTWSSLMTLFVNSNACLSYIPLTYLTDPFTITGHCFALRRTTFQAAGGLDGLNDRVDDDHELVRRVRRLDLRCVQTPLIYDVNNDLDSLQAYAIQMKRWFIFPRQAMLPFLTPKEQLVSLLSSICHLLPSLIALLALVFQRQSAIRALGISLGLLGTVHALCEVRYLKRPTPLSRWPLLAIVALFTPLHILAVLLSNNQIEWRGQRVLILKGGKMEVIP